MAPAGCRRMRYPRLTGIGQPCSSWNPRTPVWATRPPIDNVRSDLEQRKGDSTWNHLMAQQGSPTYWVCHSQTMWNGNGRKWVRWS